MNFIGSAVYPLLDHPVLIEGSKLLHICQLEGKVSQPWMAKTSSLMPTYVCCKKTWHWWKGIVIRMSLYLKKKNGKWPKPPPNDHSSKIPANKLSQEQVSLFYNLDVFLPFCNKNKECLLKIKNLLYMNK